MTIRSTVVDSRVSVQQYVTDAFGNVIPNGTVLVGNYGSKSQIGADRPKVKRVYEVFKVYRRDTGRWLTYRRRVDKPTRLKEDDHNYTCSIYDDRTTMVLIENNDPSPMNSYEKFGPPVILVNDGTGWTANDTLATVGKLRTAVAGSDFNAGVALGEGREALAMIANSAIRIRTALSMVRRLRFDLAAEALLTTPGPKYGRYHLNSWGGKGSSKIMSAGWLELQYGWLPLVQDAKAGAEFLAKVLEFPLMQTYKVRRTKRMNLSIQDGWPQKDIATLGYTRYQILARLTEVDSIQLSGLSDPLSVAWELVPYSFVADWFIPIGSYLAARGLAQALTGTFVETKTTYTEASYSRNDYQTPPYMQTFTPGARTWSRTISMERVVGTSLTVPVPSWKPLSSVASWQHCANAVALLVQKAF
jgi:hypothetical protein